LISIITKRIHPKNLLNRCLYRVTFVEILSSLTCYQQVSVDLSECVSQSVYIFNIRYILRQNIPLVNLRTLSRICAIIPMYGHVEKPRLSAQIFTSCWNVQVTVLRWGLERYGMVFQPFWSEIAQDFLTFFCETHEIRLKFYETQSFWRTIHHP